MGGLGVTLRPYFIFISITNFPYKGVIKVRDVGAGQTQREMRVCMRSL